MLTVSEQRLAITATSNFRRIDQPNQIQFLGGSVCFGFTPKTAENWLAWTVSRERLKNHCPNGLGTNTGITSEKVGTTVLHLETQASLASTAI